MNLASGVFKAPKDGTYAFAFKGESSGDGGYSVVCLTKNTSAVACSISVFNNATNGYLTVFVQATLQLTKGNIISTRLDDGAIYSSSYSDIQFTGSLLEEELVID